MNGNKLLLIVGIVLALTIAGGFISIAYLSAPLSFPVSDNHLNKQYRGVVLFLEPKQKLGLQSHTALIRVDLGDKSKDGTVFYVDRNYIDNEFFHPIVVIGDTIEFVQREDSEVILFENVISGPKQ